MENSSHGGELLTWLRIWFMECTRSSSCSRKWYYRLTRSLHMIKMWMCTNKGWSCTKACNCVPTKESSCTKAGDRVPIMDDHVYKDANHVPTEMVIRYRSCGLHSHIMWSCTLVLWVAHPYILVSIHMFKYVILGFSIWRITIISSDIFSIT